MHFLSDLLRRLRAGRGHPSFGMNATRGMYQDLTEKIASGSPMIFDVGANQGVFTDEMLARYGAPELYLFEPIPTLCEVMREKYRGKGNVRVLQYAAGNKNGTEQFNITDNVVSSSVLSPEESTLMYHEKALIVKDRISVEVRKLADFAKDVGAIDIVKLDIQGYELEALRGFDHYLADVRSIICEVEFFSVYRAQPLFAEVEMFLRNNGFYLFNLYNIWTHEDGQLEAADAFFLNGRFFRVGENYKKLGSS